MISQYLARYAEPAAEVPPRPEPYGHVIVIPAMGEGESLYQTIDSIPQGFLGDVLVIAVVNACKDAPSWVHESNRAVLEQLRSRDVFVVDCATDGNFLPEGQGVGLARKIGADIALRLYAAGRLASPWIHCTDADVKLPPDYFFRSEDWIAAADVAALVYTFYHDYDQDPQVAEAMDFYESYLRYYMFGLDYAGSPYAFHTIGSLITVRAEAYAQVRGFPKKTAGEDFYILNKLAKVGAIVRAVGSPIRVLGRRSDRVPFGTGRALSQIVSMLAAGEPYRVYHPAVFENLAVWVQSMAEAAVTGGRLEPRDLVRQRCEGLPLLQSDVLLRVLEQMGAFDAAGSAVRRSPNPATVLQHLHTWFDAFRTLKFIHALRDAGLPSLPLREALTTAPFLTPDYASEDKSMTEIRKSLFEKDRRMGCGPVGVSKTRCTFVPPKTD